MPYAALLLAAVAWAEPPSDPEAEFLGGLRAISEGVSGRGLRLPQRAAVELPALGETPPVSGRPVWGPGRARSGEAWLLYGNGVGSRGGTMEWRAIQLGIKEKIGEGLSVGALHNNEGHLPNHHRDGYAVIACLERPLAERLSAEACAGPYLTMDTTRLDGAPSSELNRKQLGLLAAAALVLKLNSKGLGLRVQGNYAAVGNLNTAAVLVGLQQELGGADSSSVGAAGGRASVSAWAGPSITTRGGHQGHAGYQVEVQRTVDSRFAYSVSVIAEGNSRLSERAGVAAQVWYIAPRAGKWEFSAGAGPYLAHEANPQNAGTKLLGIITFRAFRELRKGMDAGVQMTRVLSGYDKDQDMFLVGIKLY